MICLVPANFRQGHGSNPTARASNLCFYRLKKQAWTAGVTAWHNQLHQKRRHAKAGNILSSKAHKRVRLRVSGGRVSLACPFLSHPPTSAAISAAAANRKLHSHTSATRQPSSRRLAIMWPSRSAFRLSFFSQNCLLDEGVVFHQHSGCLCQKQP
jgi:hypothetical protein